MKSTFLVALIPLCLFALKCWEYRAPGEQYHIFWFCNLSNLFLGLAILFKVRNLIFACSVLLAIGLPIWIFDFIALGDFRISSVFTHVLSPALGLWLSRRLGHTRHAVWQTIAYYVFLQLLARALTPAPLNINVAFEVYAPVRALFPNFIVYSLANLAGLGIFTFVMHRLLKRAH